MLNVEKLKLLYPDKEVIKNLSFQSQGGEILGVVGRNGVGKTTLLNAIVGLKKINSGTLACGSKNIGYVPENQGIYDYLTGRELLEVMADLRDVPLKNCTVLLAEISRYILLPDLDILVSNYSKGNKEKLIFILALLGKPDVLVLDEPFTGFDPGSILGAKKFLLEYSNSTNLIIFSTHLLEMASQLCQRVLILLGPEEHIMVELNRNIPWTEKLELLEKYFKN